MVSALMSVPEPSSPMDAAALMPPAAVIQLSGIEPDPVVLSVERMYSTVGLSSSARPAEREEISSRTWSYSFSYASAFSAASPPSASPMRRTASTMVSGEVTDT